MYSYTIRLQRITFLQLTTAIHWLFQRGKNLWTIWKLKIKPFWVSQVTGKNWYSLNEALKKSINKTILLKFRGEKLLLKKVPPGFQISNHSQIIFIIDFNIGKDKHENKEKLIERKSAENNRKRSYIWILIHLCLLSFNFCCFFQLH